MLKQRVLTAVVLIPCVVGAVLLLPTAYVALGWGLFIVVGAWEWARLSGWSAPLGRLLYAIATALALVLIWLARNSASLPPVLLWAAALWWLCALLWLARPAWAATGGGPVRWFKALAGAVVLVSAWWALVALHEGPGPRWVLYALVLVWVADSGAYFAGRAWGRRKLAPRISPGKTWAGVWGALAAVAVGAVLTAVAAGLGRGPALYLIGLSLVLVPVAIIGDLFESLLKRQAGVKDSGALLPGHGGVLDRIDSLLAVSPIFLLGLWSGDWAG